jgi:hypothetical protein
MPALLMRRSTSPASRAAGDQRLGEGEAQSAIGAGDEGDGIFDFHIQLLFGWFEP